MARRYAPSTTFPLGRRPFDKHPADPLRRPRHETFAKAFALIPDAKAAAIEAGYPRPRAARAAGRLLWVKTIWARIQFLQTRDAEAFTTKQLVQDLHLNPQPRSPRPSPATPSPARPASISAASRPAKSPALSSALS